MPGLGVYHTRACCLQVASGLWDRLATDIVDDYRIYMDLPLPL
jgi:hypothetical protein